MNRRLWLTWMCLCACGLLASEPKNEIPKISSEPAIDGKLDKDCWQKIEPIRADYLKSKKGVLADTPQLSVKYAWDEHYLYIAYDVFDANLVAASKPGMKGPENNRRPICENWKKDELVDVVEFFISFGDEHFFWELHHNAANRFNDIFCVTLDPSWRVSKSAMAGPGILFNNQQFIDDDGAFKLATAVQLKPKADGRPSTANDSSDVDSGYTAEIRLPWRGIGAPASCAPLETHARGEAPDTTWRMAGQSITILAVVQNGDLEERYFHSSPKLLESWFHKNASRWPRYTLKAGAAVAPPALAAVSNSGK